MESKNILAVSAIALIFSLGVVTNSHAAGTEDLKSTSMSSVEKTKILKEQNAAKKIALDEKMKAMKEAKATKAATSVEKSGNLASTSKSFVEKSKALKESIASKPTFMDKVKSKLGSIKDKITGKK